MPDPEQSPADPRSSLPARSSEEPGGLSSDPPPRSPSVAAEDDAYELQNADFLAAAPHWSPSLPGPGLPESLVWTAGTVVVHILAVVLVLVGVFALYGAQHDGEIPWKDGLALESVLEAVDAQILFGGEQFIFVIVAVIAVAVRLRMSRNSTALEARAAGVRDWSGAGLARTGRLSLEQIPPGHIVVILCLVLPVALLATKGQQIFADAWNEFARSVPGMEQVDSARVVEQLLDALQGASLPTLVLILAVLPAVGEELVFRGVVARGLTARWGLVSGVLLTSLLFAVVHLDPVHAVGVFPLGIMIHVVYLATRSFWAPVLYHFLNNSIAAAGLWAASQAGDDPAALESAAQGPELPMTVYLAAVLCVVSLGLLLWRTRVEHVLADGSFWTPGYATAEVPAETLNTLRICRSAEARYYAFAAVGVVVFAAALVHGMWPAA